MQNKIESAGYSKIVNSADVYVKTKERNSIIDSLSPKQLRITADGLYIMLDGFFVGEEGIFIPNLNSIKTFSTGTDPAYTEISTRLFWYHISG